MDEILLNINELFTNVPLKIIFSKPPKNSEYRKICVLKKEKLYQLEKYTDKQVFHENLSVDAAARKCTELFEQGWKQLNALCREFEYSIAISKKGKILFSKKRIAACDVSEESLSHNRRKNYIISEDEPFPALIDMGVFTKDGKIAKPMYDKFRQINRFTEIIDDAVREMNIPQKPLKIIDFGCGKSYLTFVMYHYFTEIRKIPVEMLGLDLKADVIEKCSASAKRYGYENLRFETGNIENASLTGDVDMVVTLHACDTATDHALYNAITRGAKMIFSVPCCQHELNRQMKSEQLGILTRYGIIKERTAALCTDAIRANLLEYCGYRTQLLEFVDLEHTPKNLLIRGIKRSGRNNAQKYLEEAEKLMGEFSFDPTLYRLLRDNGIIKK